MNDEKFLALSFAATIAYGLLALAGLLLAGLWTQDVRAAGCAIAAMAFAYVSQSLTTMCLPRAARIGQAFSLALFGAGFISLMSGY